MAKAKVTKTPKAPGAGPAKKSKDGSYTVLDKNGTEVRTYSEDLHGEAAAEAGTTVADMAAGFVEKNAHKGYTLA